jgi:asparagine synthase (glutamine-hydrolysing)
MRLAHRGPDGRGTYLDGPVGLGNRRLAIIDLSSAGSQPMQADDGNIIVTYNGEIYNFRELRAELEASGHRFRSATDTEVLVHGYEEHGADLLQRLNGMFAFAVWDRNRRRMLVARDRYGVKPVYWALRDGVFTFASEIKAILAHPHFSVNLCEEALAEYFTFQNVLSDLTLFDGIKLLPAGSLLTLDVDGGEPQISRYWDFMPAEPMVASMSECAEIVRETFTAAVERQLVSDAPVGSYLSGGMDSGSIVCVAANKMPRLATFTCGFDLSSASGLELAFDERQAAEILANAFRTDHYEVVMHAGHLEWILPEVIYRLEDLRIGQCYPNYYVARLASRFVKVVMSGTGGDELFGGYPWRYQYGASASDKNEYLLQYYEFWQRLVPEADRDQLFRRGVLQALGDYSPFDVFRSVYDGWSGPYDTPEARVSASLYFELKTFLNGLLVVEDKLAMAHSLETRVPFLDDELVDLAMRMPISYKLALFGQHMAIDENISGFRHAIDDATEQGKLVLRQAMTSLMPNNLLSRVKQGFAAPDASWFRGESIQYIDRLLRSRDARLYEFLEPAYVTAALDEHTAGLANRRLLIWSLLSFEWWCRCFLDGEQPPELGDTRDRYDVRPITTSTSQHPGSGRKPVAIGREE